MVKTCRIADSCAKRFVSSRADMLARWDGLVFRVLSSLFVAVYCRKSECSRSLIVAHVNHMS